MWSSPPHGLGIVQDPNVSLESLTLSENGNDIASTTTEIGMYVTYRGTAVAGTGDVTVA